MTGRRTTFVPSVPSQDHIEEAARLFKSGSAYADAGDLETRPDYSADRRGPYAPVIAAIVGGVLAAGAAALWVLYLLGVHL